jgi:hypothetical protein
MPGGQGREGYRQGKGGEEVGRMNIRSLSKYEKVNDSQHGMFEVRDHA